MMEIYVEEQPEEGSEEQENSKRRISRPKLKYSPVPEINKKRILKKHLNRPKLNVQRINSGSAQTIFTDSSTSTLSTRENSVSGEEDFAGRDVMSQTELHQQLRKIKSEEFSLPNYDIKKILENGSFLHQTIKTAPAPAPNMEPIPIEKPRLKLKIKLPFKKHTVQSTLKRMRRPPRNSDEFIFTPLKKQSSFYKKDPLKLRQVLISRQKRQFLQQQEMATYSQSIQMPPQNRIKQRRGLKKIMKQPAIGSTQSDEPSTKELVQQVPSAEKIERPPQSKIKIPPAIGSTQQTDEPSTKELLQQVPTAEKIKRPPQPKIPEVPSVQMEFFDRLNHRKQLNPFSIGIKKCENFRDDYFYREILINDTPSKLEHENEEEEEIDCTGISPSELECKDDEKMLHNPAAEFAKAIQKEMENSEEYSPIDVEQPESDFESIIKERMNDMDSNVRSFLDILYKFIIEQRYVDTVTQGLIGGASMFHSLTMKNANRLRESLKLYNRVNQKLIVAAHCWLLKNLPIEFIASYLNILRFVKAAGSNLSDHIVSHSNGKCIARANHFIKDYIRQKIYEPPMNANFKPIEYGPIPNASLVLVYPQITAKTTKHIIRAHETLFRQLLPLVVCCVEKVELNFDVDKQITVEECAWMCIHLIRQKVNEIVKRRPNDHIFLAGWGTTCCINHKVVTRVPGVSGILNFAFPTETACGSRGSIDDEICLTYPSTLFVVGEDAFNVNMNALMRMRRNMISDTGLIVIGDANHNLLVSQIRLSIERITQFVIQRTIVEYTVQFIKQVIADLGHRRDCRELLKPVILPDMYEVDINLLKQPTTTKPKKPPGQKKAEEAERQSQIGSMQQPSTSTSAFGYGKISAHSRPTQIASHLPSGLQPVIPASSSRVGTYHAARTTFGGLLKAAKASSVDMTGGIKIPSPETLNSQVFKAATTRMAPSTSTALQDTLREEEEAAAALKF